MAEGSRKVVVAAAAANLAIAVVKAAAGLFTGSAAMLTEAVHSLVDTGDQVLLIVGQARGQRPPDPLHPFGHGLEVYFWSFVVSLLIFSLGGAVSVAEGVWRVFHPEPIRTGWVNFLVLGAAAVFEGISLLIGYREFGKARRPGVSLLRSMRRSKDPTLYATILEDSAALAGLGIAALGVGASLALGQPWADGAASIGIGLLLLVVAVFLANETRSLLTGEAAPLEVRERIRAAVAEADGVAGLDELLTLQLGPSDIFVAVRLRAVGELGRAEGAAAAAARAQDSRVGRVFVSGAGAQPPAEPSCRVGQPAGRRVSPKP